MEDVLKIAVCEDTKADEEKLLNIIESSGIHTECSVFRSGEELVQAYRPNEYDLILSDIYMSGITGVEAIAKIRQIDRTVPVAFITTSTEHALEGYRLSVLKYIEKPYTEEDIEGILKLALMEKNNAPALFIQRNRKSERIALNKIVFLEQKTHQLYIHLKGGESIQVYEKLSSFSDQLEEQGFFVPHKSYAVNLSYVRYVDSELKCFVMQSGENVPIRRESMSKAKKVLEQLLFETTRRISE